MSKHERVDWHTYNMGFSQHASIRSTCPRASVGAAAFTNNRIVLTGYNGANEGAYHCVDVGCIIVDNHCIRARHAEHNLIEIAEKRGVSLAGMTLYCTHKPCDLCSGRIIAARISRVIFLNDYGNNLGPNAMTDAGVKVQKMEHLG